MWVIRVDEKLNALGRRTAVYLFAVALAIHVCYLCQYARTPFFWAPELDSLYDDLAARSIAAGHVSHEPFFRAPFYLYFLAGIYKVFGHSFWAARLMQAVVGSASVALLYRLGSRLFRPSIGAIAATAMAFYGPLVYNDGELHTPVVEVFLDLAMLNLVALVAADAGHGINSVAMIEDSPSGTFMDSPGARWLILFLAGLLMSLSAITRPSVLTTLPVILWWAIRHPNLKANKATVDTFGQHNLDTPLPARNERRGRGAGGEGLTLALIFLAGALIFPTLVTVRNWRVSGDPVFIAAQGGINLFLGNRPEADGFTPSTPTRYRFVSEYEDSVQLYGQKAAEEALGRHLTASEAQTYWVKRSVDWWRTSPAAALQLTLKKIVLAWTHVEIRNNTAYAFVRRDLAPFLWVTCAGFWLVGPLAVAGIALGWRDQSVRRLAVFTVVYMAGFVPFFMADRYRLPVVPLLLILAAYAVVRACELARAGAYRPLRLAAAALVVGIILVDVDWVHTSTPKTWAIDYWSEGNRYVRLGKYTEAEGAYRKAIALDSRTGDYWNGLGESLYAEGRLVDAAQAFDRAATIGPDSSRGLYNEAICQEQMGRPLDAARLLEHALTLDPNYLRAKDELAALTKREGTASTHTNG